MKIQIYWTESKPWIYFHIQNVVLSKKKLKIYCSKQSFTGLGPEDWCSSLAQTILGHRASVFGAFWYTISSAE